MIGRYTKFPIQLSCIKKSIDCPINYYDEDEEELVGVHFTTPPDEYQPLEKIDLSPIRSFRGTADCVNCLSGLHIHTT